MRSNRIRIGLTALLVLGGAGCQVASTAPAPDAKAVSETPPKPTIASDCPSTQGPVDRPGHCAYPADVRDFIEMRDACDHWRGEPWATDEEIKDADAAEKEWALHRRKEITDAVNATCTGTDKRLATLKATYARDPRILKLLDEFEPDIESDD